VILRERVAQLGRGGYHGAMAAHPEPVDPVDEELAELLRHPAVKKRLDDYERRRREGRLGKGASHDDARRVAGLPPRPADRDSTA